MAEFDLELKNLRDLFPADFTEDQVNKGKTILLKELAYDLHKFYGGKMITLPKAGVYGFNWFNIWYTPGVSKISTTIRDNNDASFELTNRGNTVAVVSDSTRVLGDGDCTPPGGMGVMEGKAFLMKYLGGCDGVALCMNSYNDKKEHDPNKIIEFVKMAEPSFGAVNLEDISQPNCYKVLDKLREICDIPVWHDDAQGTGCVVLAGLLNALKVAGKKLNEVRIVLWAPARPTPPRPDWCWQPGPTPRRSSCSTLTAPCRSSARTTRANPTSIGSGTCASGPIRSA